MENYHDIIVIGRSFGAGGRATGKSLSALMGIPCYDSELLQEAAEEFGFSRSIFARADEKRPSRFKRLVTFSYGVQESFMSETLGTETLYQAQSRIIRAVAKRGPCIIIGRTADYVLRDFPGLLSVFLHAPLSYRAFKIAERGDAPSEEEAIEMARQKDKSRADYYNFFTGRQWGVASNYDLTLDSSLLPTAQNAEVIRDFLLRRNASRG